MRDLPNSHILVVAAVILACVLSKDRSAEEMGQLAAFLTVAGDTLALLALQPTCDCESVTE